MTSNFGVVLKSKRRARGLSARELAELMGISQSYISQVENGHKNVPSLKIIRKLEEALGIKSYELVQIAMGADEDKLEQIDNRLSLNDYQQLSKRTMPRHDTQHSHRETTLNFLIGANSELGELADIYKKELFHGHEQSHIEKVKELGDVLFYLAGLATLLEVDLETVARVNIEKLEKRYSNGFSTQASIERVDVEPSCYECGQPVDFNKVYSQQEDKLLCETCTLKDW